MTTSKEALTWTSLTTAVNEIKGPYTLYRDLVFGTTDEQNTEVLEIGKFIGNRDTAPFVRKNGEAIMVGGTSKEFWNIEAPNIRIKTPFRPSELFFGREPGTDIFIDQGSQISAIQRHIARDVEHMGNRITNTEEWLCSQSITGQIDYSVADEESFQITIPKPAGNTASVANVWGAAGSNPEKDVRGVKQVIHNEVTLPTQVAIGGQNAADAFMADPVIKETLDNRNIDAGGITMNEQFTAAGALFLGRVFGVDFWQYSPTLEIAGSSFELTRTDYFEFFNISPAAQWIRYYGAIPDMDALEGRQYVGQRFAKSWRQPDPSQQMFLVHSRPLPIGRRPGANFSLKVTNI